MLTPSYLANATESMVNLWSQVEMDIIMDIARRIVKNGGTLTDTAKWQIAKSQEMGALQSDLQKQLKALTKKTEKQVANMIFDACMTAMDFDDSLYKKAGYDVDPFQTSQALIDVLNAGIRKTGGLMKNFTSTTANTATKAFENALDRAYMQVLSGAFSQEEALRRTVDSLASSGVEFILYPSGTKCRMDVAARRALLTGLNQTVAELQLARMDDLGIHLVEVTSHAGARPSHAKWQGQVYWRGKKIKGYENFEAVTGYGTGDGLCGWNCYHSFYPFFNGISQRAFERDPSARLGKTNDQVYEESQKQRYYERRIRETRRECVAYSAAKEAATDPAVKASMDSAFQSASVRLKRREAALDDFIAQTGRTKLPERARVYGFNHKVSSQAVWANKKALASQSQMAAQAFAKQQKIKTKAPAPKPKAPPPARVSRLAKMQMMMSTALKFSTAERAAAMRYHEQNNFSWDFWNNSLNDRERDGVRKYTDYHYGTMNSDLRKGNYANSTKKKLIDWTTTALEKSSVKDDIWVYRGMGDMHALSAWTGIPIDELRKKSLQESLVKSHQTLTEKAFMSAGVEPSAAWSGVKLDICIPAGSKAFYVDPISEHQGEAELLIQRNSTFEIMDIKANPRTGDVERITLVLIKQELP